MHFILLKKINSRSLSK